MAVLVATVASLSLGLSTATSLLMVLNLILLQLVGRSARSLLLCPSWIFSGALTLFAIGGYMAADWVVNQDLVTAALLIRDPQEKVFALNSFLIGSSATCCGSLMVSRGASASGKMKLSFREPLLRVGKHANLIACASLLVNVAVRPLHDIVSRDTYLISTPIGGVLTYLQIPASLLLGVSASSGKLRSRIASLVFLLGFLIFSFSLSSRMLSLVSLMFFVGLAIGSKRLRFFWGAGGATLALFTVPIPLYMRGRPTQGLIPNWHNLPNVDIGSADALRVSFANIISSFNVTAISANGGRGSIPWSSFVVAVNPLPGFLSSGSNFNLRISGSIPFSGVGEIANHGLQICAIFFLLIGIVLQLASAQAMKLAVADGSALWLVGVAGIAFLASILFAEYNLRTCMRMIYLLILIVSVLRLVNSRSGREVIIGSER